MSKVEVNQVTQQCGTTLTVGGGACKTAVVDATTVTLGRCGATVSLASGATQSGFGRTGTVDWQTDSIKTSGFTPTNGEGYFCNTSGGAFAVTLPAGVAGNIVAFADYTRSFVTYNLTLTPNGAEKIGGVADDATLNVSGQSATFVYVDGTEGWVNINETQSSVTGVLPFITACGGTPSTCGDYKVHKFTGPGTFTVNNLAICSADNAVAYMVVAGGGSGGSSWRSGGGGAGGFREGTTSPIVPYSASPLVAATGITVTASAYSITVGGGGTAGGPNLACKGTNGADSIFSTITSTGGGVAGTYNPASQPDHIGSSGGSGGGGGGSGTGGPTAGGAGDTPNVTPDQGFPGGSGCCSDTYSAGGGGGGATVAGSSTYSPATLNVGGAGATTSISGSPTAYAGGGGGGQYVTVGSGSPAGGTGGGGSGGEESTPGVYDGQTSGTVNTGGGGGGKSGTSSAGLAGAGGSGIVIIRYKFQ